MTGGRQFIVIATDAAIDYGTDVFYRDIGFGKSFFGSFGSFNSINMAVSPPSALTNAVSASSWPGCR